MWVVGRWVVVFTVCAPVCVGSVSPAPARLSSEVREGAVWVRRLHRATAGAILPGGSPTGCESLRAAEALATPDPLLDRAAVRGKVAVSFVIGTDGRVHSPVVLQSAGAGEDSNVLEAVRGWRYRPAMCNAVPAEAESKVEFSSR
jgi:TonB family protein